VPALDPPYDDELPGYASAAGGLWLLSAPAEQLPFEESAPGRGTAADDFAGPGEPRAPLPCPRRTAAHLVQGIMEVLAGRRAIQQLMPVTTEHVYEELGCRVAALRTLRTRRGVAVSSPARLHSMRVDEPAEGVAEVSAVVRRGDRHRAVALRLEGADGRWRCTALQLL
jgi:hypothetical protein